MKSGQAPTIVPSPSTGEGVGEGEGEQSEGSISYAASFFNREGIPSFTPRKKIKMQNLKILIPLLASLSD